MSKKERDEVLSLIVLTNSETKLFRLNFCHIGEPEPESIISF